MKIRCGSILMIVGKKNSGKSSVLKSILGQTFLLQGKVTVNGKIGYVPDAPQFLNASLRSNILLERPFDEERFLEVLRLSGVDKESKKVPGGLLHVVDAKLSALDSRLGLLVCLARELYGDPDILLLDDFLDHLGPQTARTVFQRVILEEFMFKGKTVILATSNLRFLNQASRVVFLDDGRILKDGPYAEVMANRRFSKFFIGVKNRSGALKHEKYMLLSLSKVFTYNALVFDEFQTPKEKSPNPPENEAGTGPPPDQKLTSSQVELEEETRSHPNKWQTPLDGKAASSKHFFYFLQKSNQPLFVLAILTLGCQVGLKVFLEFLLGAWILNLRVPGRNDEDVSFQLLLIYITLGLIVSLIWAKFFASSTLKYYKSFIQSVLRKPPYIIDQSNQIQIVNVIQKNMESFDICSQKRLNRLFVHFFQILVIFVFLSVSNFVVLPVIFLLSLWIFFMMKSFFLLKNKSELVKERQVYLVNQKIHQLYLSIEIFKNESKWIQIENEFSRSVNCLTRVYLNEKYSYLATHFFIRLAILLVVLVYFTFALLGAIYKWSFLLNSASIVYVNLTWAMFLPWLSSEMFSNFDEAQKQFVLGHSIFNKFNDEVTEGSELHPFPRDGHSFPVSNSIEIKNISLGFSPNTGPLFRNFSLTLKKNERVAIYGDQKSGKDLLFLALTGMLRIGNSGFNEQVSFGHKSGKFRNISKSRRSTPLWPKVYFNDNPKQSITFSKKGNSRVLKYEVEFQLLQDLKMYLFRKVPNSQEEPGDPRGTHQGRGAADQLPGAASFAQGRALPLGGPGDLQLDVEVQHRPLRPVFEPLHLQGP